MWTTGQSIQETCLYDYHYAAAQDIPLKTPTLVSADVTIRMPITTDKHNNNVHPLFPTNNANVTLTEIIP